MNRGFLALAMTLVSSLTWALEPSQEPTVLVVEKLRPAVVNIYTERIIEQTVLDPFDDFYERFFGGGLTRGNRIVLTPVRNLGSGLLVSPEGYIVTNHHVAERASDLKIKVTLSDGATYDAKLVRDDPDLDLSLIKISRPEPLPCFDISQLSPNLLGETVIAIGNPVGYESSVSQGILSAKDRTLTIDGLTMEGLIQTDAAINPGNSGGPLVDINGKLVGLNTAKMAAARDIVVENIGFAVPGDRIKTFVDDAIAIAKGTKPAPPEVSLLNVFKEKFGLHLQELTPDLSRGLGYRNTQGLLVSDVDASSPAAAAGIEQGMLLVGLATRRIRTEADLPRDLTRVKKGDQVRMTFVVLKSKDNFMIQRSASVVLTAR